MSVAINGTNGITYNDGSLQPSAPVGKNKIINGDMLIAQRGTSGTPTAAGEYLACDRWKAWEASDASVTVSQETDAPTGKFKECLKYNITTADSSITASQFGMVRQMIEGHNIIDLGFGTASAKTVTLSFWVKSSLTGSHGGALNNGNEDRSYPFAYTVSVANTWEYKTITIAGDTSGTWDTDNTAGMIVTFGLGTGTTYQGTADAWQAGNKFQPSGTIQNIGTISNWNVTGVQLEAGTTATPFEYLHYGQQLALCQRYFYTESQADSYHNLMNGFYASTSLWIGVLHLPVPLKSSPTLTVSGSWQTSGASPNSSTASGLVSQDNVVANLNCVQIRANVSITNAGQGATLRNNNDTSAKFELSSEF